jgi:subtilisin family serine protease
MILRNKTLLGLICLMQAVLTVKAQDMSKMNFSLAKRLTEYADHSRPIALFAQGNTTVITAYVRSHGGAVKFIAGDIVSFNLPLGMTYGLAALPEVTAVEDNDMKLEPMDDSMRVRNNINPIHAGQAPLPQAYDGSGVIMGIIDSGIDFTHPDFKKANGDTRVLFIWDHNLSSGPAPMPYNYGTEFNAADINSGNATAHVDNSNGHGTHVTGIAVGNGSALNAHKGVAPAADIISVCVNWNLSDNNWLTTVADAVNYIYSKAAALNRPCVINISAGTYYGSHDAKDLQAQAIANLIAQTNGRSLVCAAGNAGNIPIHLQHQHTSATDTSFTWFTYNAAYGPSIYIEMWANVANFSQMKFAVGADLVSPVFENLVMGTYYTVSQNTGMIRTDTLYGPSGNRIARIQRFASLANGRYSMIFNILPDSTQYRYRLSTTQIGKFDLWSFQMTPASALPTAQQFPEIVNYSAPDFNQTIVSSFSCSDKVITVGEHKNRMTYTDCTNNLFTSTTNYTPGSLAPQSSHGPTRDNRLKPEICASGGMSLAAGAYNVLPNLPATSKALGCLHIRDGGTSTASPVVAGIAALILQRYPNASWQDIKNCITQNATVDSLVGSGLPNNSWGYGRANGFNALLGCSFLSVNEAADNGPFITAVVNNGQAIINASVKLTHVEIFDLMGRSIYGSALPSSPSMPYQYRMPVPVMAPAIYTVRLTAADGFKYSMKTYFK